MNSMPEEVLVHIFKFLDDESLKNSANVCERWRSSISTCTSIVKRLESSINLAEKNPAEMREILDASNNLPYSNFICSFEANDSTKDNGMLTEAMMIHSEYIEKITFEYVPLIKVIPIIENSSKLTHLKVLMDFYDSDEKIVPLAFPHLKSLYISLTVTLLKMIKVHKLDTLIIDDAMDLYEDSDKVVGDFLKTCKDLKHLELYSYFPNIDFEELNLKIETVVLKEPRLTGFTYLTNFLTDQCETLENVELISSNSKSIEIFEICIKRLKLKTLKYEAKYSNPIEFNDSFDDSDESDFDDEEDEFDENEFYYDDDVFMDDDEDFMDFDFDDQIINTTIKELDIHYMDQVKSNMWRLVRKCTAVETIRISSTMVYGFFNVTAPMIPTIREITVADGNLYHFYTKLPNVQVLTFDCISEEEHLQSLVNAATVCLNVKHLKINNWSYMTANGLNHPRNVFFLVLNNCRSLEEITIGQIDYIADDIIDILNVYAKNLKKLNVGIKMRPEWINCYRGKHRPCNFEFNIKSV